MTFVKFDLFVYVCFHLESSLIDCAFEKCHLAWSIRVGVGAILCIMYI